MQSSGVRRLLDVNKLYSPPPIDGGRSDKEKTIPMRVMFPADWAFGFVGVIEQNVRGLFPELLRSWPIIQSFDSEAYMLPENYVLFVMKDRLSGTPSGPSRPKEFPFTPTPPLPPKVEDIPLWQFYVREKFQLRQCDTSFMIPGHDCGRHDVRADYEMFSPQEQFFWNEQLAFVINQQRQYLESIMTSKNSPQISYNVSGANARINLNSTDNSTNIVNDTTELFEALINATSRIDNEAQREAIDASIRQMQASIGQKNFIERYQHFIAVASDHLGVFGPLIAQLSALIGS